MCGRAHALVGRMLILALPLVSPLGAQTVLSNYSFEGSSNNASSVATGLTVDPLATNGINYLGPASGTAPPDNSTYFGWIRPYSATVGLSTDAADQNDWAGALTAGDYLSIGVTVAPGYTLSLSSVTLSTGMAGFLNITAGFGVYTDVTGFTGSPLATGFVSDPSASPTWAALSLDLSGNASLQNLGPGTYAVRLYLTDNYYTAHSAQSIYLDNISLNGSVSAIPEPSTWTLAMACATMGYVGWRRRSIRRRESISRS